jgi:FKBP-type peptidyl-prolyl cis-trans isomerase FklB
MTIKSSFLIGMMTALAAFAQQVHAQQVTLKTSSDTLQYAAGAYVGQWLKTNGITITDFDVLKKGINDQNTGKLLLPDSLLSLTLTEQVNNNQIAAAQAQEQQLFASVKTQKGVGMLPSGVAYLIGSAGAGVKPSAKDSVELEVRGVLPNGQLFIDTYQTKQPLRTNVSALIPGLSEGIQLMSAGSIWRIFVPSALAYGNKGSGSIPPHTALIFQVELKKVFEK